MSQSFVTHLEAAINGTRLPAGQVHGTHEGRPIWVRYDLDAIRNAVTPDEIAKREPTLWRYRELLPLPFDAEPVSLGEGMSPLLHCPRLGQSLGMSQLYVKDESQLPTGSFKSRGMTAALSLAKHLGITRVALPTAGNAGGGAAAYSARAGIECFVFMPEDTPIVNQMEAYQFGAKVFLVNGLINDCGRLVREGAARMGWFDLSTLKEPYRLEGKKTMGLELAEQLGWHLPDVILYPTGGGTGLVGMHKAFAELRQLGWLKTDKVPRLISCQAEGCAPIARAFDKGERFAELFPNAATVASGLRVPVAVGDFMILDAIRESGGTARTGKEANIAPWMVRSASAEGISICPETAVCFDVLESMLASGEIRPDESVVVFNTGAAQKYLEALPLNLPKVNKDQPIDAILDAIG
ncbi:threonine synthase [Tuwongella immobilis]|uniref:Tryptophan synthase beta chain-like PALP domain-containing protein n=1 Tax=Tuwongella immobilis TaxID=692036 RepID=A0A6C2YQM1_9BACT|nr:threonine synthase [Tuwongella immobilis]VIP03631.1 threonine synthase : Threonine synthase OS=Candidatus Entotheonella sp. TSY1 GN=ETSY1_27390 PE=4 SV=1: PALP [Tuwongella immobilis]VTS04630.1 threonine synthase : Threonine synthase OS=Candidatus Entotheonella sp. TSY1 GN=ETSY1_27390 PE=4 SV=1: PALP [Tuwongella immobilis]